MKPYTLQEDKQSGPSGDESGGEEEEEQPSTEKVEKVEESEPITESKYIQKQAQCCDITLLLGDHEGGRVPAERLKTQEYSTACIHIGGSFAIAAQFMSFTSHII